MKKTVFTLCAALAASFVLSACNTISRAPARTSSAVARRCRTPPQKTKEKM